jgi:hypothetical protein
MDSNWQLAIGNWHHCCVILRFLRRELQHKSRIRRVHDMMLFIIHHHMTIKSIASLNFCAFVDLRSPMEGSKKTFRNQPKSLSQMAIESRLRPKYHPGNLSTEEKGYAASAKYHHFNVILMRYHLHQINLNLI